MARGNTLLGRDDISRLMKLGLSDPPVALRRDLVTHSELIPFKSGQGRFQFIPQEAILLPGQWVCAYYEDGHTPGHVLLQYEVRPGGRFVWRRLAVGRPD